MSTGSPQARRAIARPRNGTSLVEVLIAAVMMTVAVLGLLGSSTSISQQMGAGRRQMMAASIAQRRLDSLLSVPCSALSATPTGSGVSSGIQESWTVSGSGATRRVTLSLVLPRLKTPYTYTTLVPCQ
ncbi:type IV pilus modification PilV family protein [Gemmatimonas phototrophica]|uniref:type IV pilus modification PilV family protein n=1 Tax=Gemmatimonas phototrophica TaxID=1379270 RepID=UPI0011AE44B0|nr:hypothetical protein [Gemmatimonas phototrophica]